MGGSFSVGTRSFKLTSSSADARRALTSMGELAETSPEFAVSRVRGRRLEYELVERSKPRCGCVDAQLRESIRVRLEDADSGCVARIESTAHSRRRRSRRCRWESRFDGISSTWAGCTSGARELGVIVLLVSTFIAFAWAMGSMIVFAECPQEGPLQPLRAVMGLFATGLFGTLFLCALDRRWRGPIAQARHLVALFEPRLDTRGVPASRMLETRALHCWRDYDPVPLADDGIDDPYR